MSVVSYDRNLFRAIRLSLIQGSFHRKLKKQNKTKNTPVALNCPRYSCCSEHFFFFILPPFLFPGRAALVHANDLLSWKTLIDLHSIYLCQILPLPLCLGLH